MTTAEASEPQRAPAPAAAGRGRMESAILTFCAIVILLCLCFAPTIGTMIETWLSSSSFHHGFAVAPIAAWLILRIEGVVENERAVEAVPEHSRAFRDPARALAANSVSPSLAPRTWTPALALIACGLMAWLAGRAASVNFVEEAAFVSTVIGCVMLVFGPVYARRWAFPLGFLFFMVPFGDAVIPALQNVAAGGVIALLKASGVSAVLDGVMIDTAAGRFEVAEACAGLNFLIAAIMVGALFAHLSFKGVRKSAAFVLLAALLALVANILRAYIVILAATLSDGRIAIGADHVVFGWVFYGALLFALVIVGKMFADPQAESESPARFGSAAGAPAWPLAAGLALILLAAGYGRLVIDRAPDTTAPSFLPLANAPGWRALPPSTDWRAPLSHADRIVQALYQSSAGAVDLNAAYFTYDRKGAEIAGHDTRSYDGEEWRRVETRKLAFSAYGAKRMLDVEMIENAAGERLETVSLYWLGDEIYADPVALKLRQTRLRLFGRRPRGGAFVLAAPAPAAMDGAKSIQAFLSDIEPLNAWLARIDARTEN